MKNQIKNEGTMQLEQKLAKQILEICKKYLVNNNLLWMAPTLSFINEVIDEIVEQHPDADIKKLESLLSGRDEYSLASILDVSESEDTETVVLGQDSSE